tara:strand:- start:198 stop:1901 length:1704 start_codon:yes stop_codon:yes gene_type:complete
MAKETLNLEVKSNIKSVTKDTDKMADSLEDVNKEAKDGIGNFTLMGVSLNGIKTAMGRVIPMAKAMFGSIKAGLISTGIGAFVVLIGSLVAYFTQTKRGADLLKQGMAALGAVVSVLTDLFSSVGEKAVSAFTDPKKAITELWEFIKDNLMNRLTGMVDGFKSAGKIIQSALSFDWDGVKEGALDYGTALIQVTTGLDVEQQKAFLDGIKDIGNEMKKEAAAMSALEKRTQALRDADMEFMIQKAKTRKEIEKARLIAEDETKSAKERLDNLKRALELEEETTKKELVLARERMAIQKQEMLLSENSAEDEQKLAELKTEIIEKETASIKMRRRVVTEVNALEREILAEEKARAKEKQDIIDAEWDAKIKANDEWNKAQQEAAKKEIAIEQAVADAKTKIRDAQINNIASGLNSIKALAGENKAIMAGVIIAENALGIARTIISTQASNTTAIAEGAALAIPTAGASVAAASGLVMSNNIAAGLSIAASIAAAQQGLSALGKGGATGGSAPSGGGGSDGGIPAPQMMSGAFELTGGTEPEPLQAYVVSDDITDSQNSLAIIRRRATI